MTVWPTKSRWDSVEVWPSTRPKTRRLPRSRRYSPRLWRWRIEDLYLQVRAFEEKRPMGKPVPPRLPPVRVLNAEQNAFIQSLEPQSVHVAPVTESTEQPSAPSPDRSVSVATEPPSTLSPHRPVSIVTGQPSDPPPDHSISIATE